MKYYALDIETTGLNVETSMIIQYSMVYDDLSIKVKDEDLDEYIKSLPFINLYIMPEDSNIYGNLTAITMNIEILKKIKEKLPLVKNIKYLTEQTNESKQIEDFNKTMPFNCEIFINKEFVSDYILEFIKSNSKSHKDNYRINLAGKNLGTFDIKFCQKHIPRFSETIKFRHRLLDPAILYLNIEDDALPNMETCFNRANIDKPVSHTALEDAYDTIRLLRKGLK